MPYARDHKESKVEYLIAIKELTTKIINFVNEQNKSGKKPVRNAMADQVCELSLKILESAYCANEIYISKYTCEADYIKRRDKLQEAQGDIKTLGISMEIYLNVLHSSYVKTTYNTKDENGNIQGFKNIEQLSQHTVEEECETFKKLKKNYPNKYLLVSVMARTEEEWAKIAKAVEEAGADAIELNFSCPNMVEEGTGSDVGQIPELVERFTRVVKNAIKIPVLAKLTPNVQIISPAAEAAIRGGADGLSAINTIKSVILDDNTALTISADDFDEIRRIILYQNILDYTDRYIDPDVRKTVDDYYRLKNKDSKNVPLEHKMICVQSKTGMSIESIGKLTIRNFLQLFSIIVEESEYTALKLAECNGIKFKTPIEHWAYKARKDKYSEAFCDADSFINEVQSAN